ncbi:MAG: bifunctional phosphoribosylaminoimidazolecarboxamide formyltransferase/IMP cyclohydrolase [Candidatus ainarchaeum sp.]|nr:bifunctional phosphoribosylaminoimidazolecarboxamide formyltransferase/IMP cyclohydrolase [Candidatus ainarchaeum sp.]
MGGSGNVSVKRALVSVSDKAGIAEFAGALQSGFGVEIISTGGTAKELKSAGVKVEDVSDYTGFPEMMGGRVKTLHPRIHGGILARRANPGDAREAAERGIGFIDLVAVNLYPFEKTVASPHVALADAVEQIDIGGPSMVRSAAKNFESVAVVTNPSSYAGIIAELKSNSGALSLETRKRLALEAFAHTARYDAAISNYLYSAFSGTAEKFPRFPPFSFEKAAELRYGENPHQQAALYQSIPRAAGPCMANATQLQGGKGISYNNVLDGDSALGLLREFSDSTAAVIVKHNNPCGVATGKTLREAFLKARATDPDAAFGGVVTLNETVDGGTAGEIITQLTDVIVAPDYSPEALRVFAQKRNLRIMRVGEIKAAERKPRLECRSVVGGLLVQDSDGLLWNEFKVVTRRAPTKEEIEGLEFALKVCKHTKSNSIIYAFSDRTVGIGAGQMKRSDSSKLGAMKAKESLKGASAASDAFFPFRDGVDVIAETGATAIAQPGGSIRDAEVVAAADEHGMAMVFTGVRHFKH